MVCNHRMAIHSKRLSISCLFIWSLIGNPNSSFAIQDVINTTPVPILNVTSSVPGGQVNSQIFGDKAEAKGWVGTGTFADVEQAGLNRRTIATSAHVLSPRIHQAIGNAAPRVHSFSFRVSEFSNTFSINGLGVINPDYQPNPKVKTTDFEQGTDFGLLLLEPDYEGNVSLPVPPLEVAASPAAGSDVTIAGATQCTALGNCPQLFAGTAHVDDNEVLNVIRLSAAPHAYQLGDSGGATLYSENGVGNPEVQLVGINQGVNNNAMRSTRADKWKEWVQDLVIDVSQTEFFEPSSLIYKHWRLKSDNGTYIDTTSNVIDITRRFTDERVAVVDWGHSIHPRVGTEFIPTTNGMLNTESVTFKFYELAEVFVIGEFGTTLPVEPHLFWNSVDPNISIPTVKVGPTQHATVLDPEGVERLLTVAGDVAIHRQFTGAGVYNSADGSINILGVAVSTPLVHNAGGVVDVRSRQLVNTFEPDGPFGADFWQVNDSELTPFTQVTGYSPGIGYDPNYFQRPIPAAITPSVLLVGEFGGPDGTSFSPDGHTGLFKNTGVLLLDDYSHVLVDGDFVHSGTIIGEGTGVILPEDPAHGRLINDGSTWSPGNSIGHLGVDAHVLVSGGTTFEIEVADFESLAGTGWDSVSMRSLTFAPNSLLTINVSSLNVLTQQIGDANNFVSQESYSLPFLSVEESISSFEEATIEVVSDTFMNDVFDGQFSVVQKGQELHLVFTPVPEPGQIALISVGLFSGTLILKRNISTHIAT